MVLTHVTEYLCKESSRESCWYRGWTQISLKSCLWKCYCHRCGWVVPYAESAVQITKDLQSLSLPFLR